MHIPKPVLAVGFNHFRETCCLGFLEIAIFCVAYLSREKRVTKSFLNSFEEFLQDPFDNPVLWRWFPRVGAVIGFLVGLFVGFISAGIGGAIVYSVCGLLLGGVCGFFLALIVAALIPFIYWAIMILVIILAIVGIVWLVHLLWNVGKP